MQREEEDGQEEKEARNRALVAEDMMQMIEDEEDDDEEEEEDAESEESEYQRILDAAQIAEIEDEEEFLRFRAEGEEEEEEGEEALIVERDDDDEEAEVEAAALAQTSLRNRSDSLTLSDAPPAEIASALSSRDAMPRRRLQAGRSVEADVDEYHEPRVAVARLTAATPTTQDIARDFQLFARQSSPSVASSSASASALSASSSSAPSSTDPAPRSPPSFPLTAHPLFQVMRETPYVHTSANPPPSLLAHQYSFGRPYFITAQLVSSRGWDMQNILWRQMRDTRAMLRARRDRDYGAFDGTPGPSLLHRKQATPLVKSTKFYEFESSSQTVLPQQYHMQLRHLMASFNNSTVATLNHLGNVCWYDSIQNSSGTLLDLNSPRDRNNQHYIMSLGLDSQSDGHLLMVGGKDGELWMLSGRSARQLRPMICVAPVANSIVNAITFTSAPSGARWALLSNNDCFARVMDVATQQTVMQVNKPVPINYALASPDTKMIALCADDKDCWLVDATSLEPIATLRGHETDNFSASFHPCGNELITGSQDCTARIWDLRKLNSSSSASSSATSSVSPACLHLLVSHFAPIRSVRYSSDGAHIFLAESADIVTIRQRSDLTTYQEIDFFGEINGLALSASDDALWLGVAEPHVGGILSFRRRFHTNEFLQDFEL